MKIVIIGAGPTGLGSAHHLNSLGHESWQLIESQPFSGGLASSFVDDQGFTWDIGGHVQFSHYEYFDNAMISLLGEDGWLHHERESWVWIRDRFIPYPFQNNIHRLPEDDLNKCLQGLVEITNSPCRNRQTSRSGSTPHSGLVWRMSSWSPTTSRSGRTLQS